MIKGMDERKIWDTTRVVCKAFGPMLLYLVMPATCTILLQALFGVDNNIQAGADSSGNFYNALGIFLFLMILHWRSKKSGNGLFGKIRALSQLTTRKRALYFFVNGVALNILLTAVVTLLNRVWFLEFLFHNYTDMTDSLMQATNAWLVLLSIGILAPLAEEFVFRKYMLENLAQLLGQKRAVYLVSLVFALCHANLFWMIYAFVFGLVLAKIVIEEKNLLYAILLHIGFNAQNLLAFFVNNDEGVSQLLYRYPAIMLLYGGVGAAILLLLHRNASMGSLAERK